MMRFILLLPLFILITQAKENIQSLQFSGVSSTYKEKKMFIERLSHPKCLHVGITPEHIFGGDLAGEEVPKECKKSFVTTLGIVQPITLGQGIQTVGELEVLKFLKLLDISPDEYAIVDSRKETWYQEISIPHAINIPYTDIAFDEHFPDDFKKNLNLLNISIQKDKLDFSKAKKIILFCNGSWCAQSARAIQEFIKLGYPPDKLFWYRGGLQDWIGLGFTTIKP
jgi:rhodanese-related sulfurtransferase